MFPAVGFQGAFLAYGNHAPTSWQLDLLLGHIVHSWCLSECTLRIFSKIIQPQGLIVCSIYNIIARINKCSTETPPNKDHLAFPMLVQSTRVQFFLKLTHLCHVGIHRKALDEHPCAGFSAIFQFYLYHFVMAKLAHSSIRAKYEHLKFYCEQTDEPGTISYKYFEDYLRCEHLFVCSHR